MVIIEKSINKNAGEKAKRVPSGKEYLEILKVVKNEVSSDEIFNSLVGLSIKAYNVSEEENKRIKEEQMNQIEKNEVMLRL